MCVVVIYMYKKERLHTYSREKKIEWAGEEVREEGKERNVNLKVKEVKGSKCDRDGEKHRMIYCIGKI
jgi:hypothetical protein